MNAVKKMLLPLLVAFSTLSFGQSLSLSYGDTDFSNDTLYVIGTTDSTLLEAHISVHNKTDKEVAVKVKKAELTIIDSTENTFCWGACFPPFISESPEAVTIAAYGTDLNAFLGDYSPKGHEGTSIIRYTFFNDTNADDSVSLTVYYQIGAAGVADWLLDAGQVKLYPNPASNQVVLRFPTVLTRKTELIMLGITGQTVYIHSLHQGEREHRIDLSSFPQGNYFLRITDAQGGSHYKKLIISR